MAQIIIAICLFFLQAWCWWQIYRSIKEIIHLEKNKKTNRKIWVPVTTSRYPRYPKSSLSKNCATEIKKLEALLATPKPKIEGATVPLYLKDYTLTDEEYEQIETYAPREALIKAIALAEYRDQWETIQ